MYNRVLMYAHAHQEIQRFQMVGMAAHRRVRYFGLVIIIFFHHHSQGQPGGVNHFLVNAAMNAENISFDPS